MPKTWADPKASRAAKQAARMPRERLWQLAGLVGALLVAAVLGAFLLTSRSNSRAEQNSRTDHEIATLLAGIPQEGRTLGWRMAPVTLQVFADLECNDVKRWVLRLLPAIIHEFVRTGIMKIEYRSFKTDTIDPKTFVNQQTASVAASTQNRLWNFVETFYHEQGREYTPYATESYIDGIASQVPGLDLTQWHHDRQTGRRTEQVVSDDQAARADGFHDTPAFRLGRTGGPLKNFIGREVILYAKQINPVSLIDTLDLERAIKKIH